VKQELTIGKYRGLQQISDDQHVFTIVALDHRGSLKRALNPADPGSVTYQQVVDLKLAVATSLAPRASGMLMDLTYTAPESIASGAMPGRAGLLITLEDSGYQGQSHARQSRLVPGWNVDKVRRMGASAVKLLLYYHPAAETAAHQEKLLRQVAADCHTHDIPLVLEVLIYSVDPDKPMGSEAFAPLRPQVVIESARRLCPLGADAYKAEFPVDVRYEEDEKRMLVYCQELTKAAGVPWMLLSAGVDHETFCRQVEIACQGGASGFLAGRSIWKDALALTGPARQAFLADEATRRLDELSGIARTHARPWTDGYACKVSEGWLNRY
jgi:tagatose 1,6-diphosphate aldolase